MSRISAAKPFTASTCARTNVWLVTNALAPKYAAKYVITVDATQAVQGLAFRAQRNVRGFVSIKHAQYRAAR